MMTEHPRRAHGRGRSDPQLPSSMGGTRVYRKSATSYIIPYPHHSALIAYEDAGRRIGPCPVHAPLSEIMCLSAGEIGHFDRAGCVLSGVHTINLGIAPKSRCSLVKSMLARSQGGAQARAPRRSGIRLVLIRGKTSAIGHICSSD